jgi:hypothetical protein
MQDWYTELCTPALLAPPAQRQLSWMSSVCAGGWRLRFEAMYVHIFIHHISHSLCTEAVSLDELTGPSEV